jgi:Ca2+-binding EF-hand superfamily protein
LDASGLEPEETKRLLRDLRDDILVLHESWTRQCRFSEHKGKALGANAVISILIEYGLGLKDGPDMDAFKELYERLDSNGDRFLEFCEFLELFLTVRARSENLLEKELMRLFMSYKPGREMVLTGSVVAKAIANILLPRCKEDRDDLTRLVMEADVDNSHTISFEEFKVIHRKVRARLRASQRRRENLVIQRLGISVPQVTALRNLFFKLDVNSNLALDVAELRQGLTMIKVDITPEELHRLLWEAEQEADVEGIADAGMDFETFIRFMHAVDLTTKAEQTLSASPTANAEG